MMELSPENMSFEDPLRRSLSYIPANRDTEFLQRDELRSVRIGLELLKPELIQHEQGIQSTDVGFWNSRRHEPPATRETQQLAEVAAARRHNDRICQQQVALARRQLNLSAYYDVTRKSGLLVSLSCQVDGHCDYIIVTEEGPGIMEAVNRGAADAHAESIGFNITLPHELHLNSYISPELGFQFRYFAIRKMHFLIRAKALVAFLGGFRTLDELFETLTLLQTRKTGNVMVGQDFGERLIKRQFPVGNGQISQSDLQLSHYAETAQEAWGLIGNYNGAPPS